MVYNGCNIGYGFHPLASLSLSLSLSQLSFKLLSFEMLSFLYNLTACHSLLLLQIRYMIQGILIQLQQPYPKTLAHIFIRYCLQYHILPIITINEYRSLKILLCNSKLK